MTAICPPPPTPPLPEESDDALLARINAGEPDAALTALQERYGKRILHFVRRRLRDEHFAQDVTQEVFARVFFKSHLYQPGTNFRAWLFEIARNQVRSALRTHRHDPIPASSFSESDGDRPLELRTTHQERRLEEVEMMEAFDQACARLPENYARAFELCVRQGLTYQQAADRLGLPTGTIGIRIMRARKRLFATLSPLIGRLRMPPACVQ